MPQDFELKPFSDFELRLYKTSEFYRTCRLLIKFLGSAGCIYLFGKTIQPFAGEVTFVSVALSVLADLKFEFAIALAGSAAAWAVTERLLRYRKTEYLQDRIRKLETAIDPERSSSGLHPTGRTDPRDRKT